MRSARSASVFGECDDLSIAAALTRGGIKYDVTCGELQALLRGLADALPTNSNEASRAARMVSGDGLDEAVVQEGIAILGLDRPIRLPAVEPMLRLVFLAAPIAAGDGHRPIDVLFLILGPDHAGHITLRNKLKMFLDSAELRRRLSSRVPADALLACFRDLESNCAVAAR